MGVAIKTAKKDIVVITPNYEIATNFLRYLSMLR